MKALGYLLMIVGAVGALTTFEPVKKLINISLPEGISETTLLIGSIVIALIGVMLSVKKGHSSSPKAGAEVPIYEGNKIVGYRRV